MRHQAKDTFGGRLTRHESSFPQILLPSSYHQPDSQPYSRVAAELDLNRSSKLAVLHYHHIAA